MSTKGTLYFHNLLVQYPLNSIVKVVRGLLFFLIYILIYLSSSAKFISNVKLLFSNTEH